VNSLWISSDYNILFNSSLHNLSFSFNILQNLKLGVFFPKNILKFLNIDPIF